MSSAKTSSICAGNSGLRFTSRFRGENGLLSSLRSMALKSVYLPTPQIQNGTITITDEEHRHLVVGRAEPAELVEVFDGIGHVWTCEVVEVGKRQTSAKVQQERLEPPPKVNLILGQALIRSAAFELALEKAVEVGVTRIIPFVAARSNSAAERRERWQRII